MRDLNYEFANRPGQKADLAALQGGYFVEHVRNKKLLHKNTLVQYGASAILQTIFQGASVLAATWYIGLTSANYTFDQATLLAALAADEPSGNGYARISIAQSNVGWPTISEVNSVYQATSKVCAFTASGNWNIPWTRMFLCDASSGTSGNVIAVSGPAPAPRTVLSGAPPSVQYTFWLRG